MQSFMQFYQKMLKLKKSAKSWADFFFIIFNKLTQFFKKSGTIEARNIWEHNKLI